MVFSSTVFLFLFLPLLLIFYFLPIARRHPTHNRVWKNAVLLAFSIGFYAWGEPGFVWIMLATILLNWLLVLFMARSEKHKKRWLILAVVPDVLLLGVFKYAGFLSENLAALTGNQGLILRIALPIGISFFSFQMMSYCFDVYYGHAKAQKNPLYVALYITLFPQLIAGPIVRYQEVADEILVRRESYADLAEGVKRFVVGLGKKMLLANFMAEIADNVFDCMPGRTVAMAWLGAIAYALQIYYDFSGYSDMAIGLGRMFGFHFSENFNFPYISASVTEFWRRWHISLGSWFRDYVYIPMGGNRVSKGRWVLNLFVVWLLTGIWHGANWTFVLWGLLFFVFLLLEKLTGFPKKIGFLKYVYTLVVVLVGWVIFRSADVGSGLTYIGHLFGIGAQGFFGRAVILYLRNTWLVLLLALIGVTPLVSGLFGKLREKNILWVENVWLCLVLIASLLMVISSTYNPFIYFNF